jgi:demethylmenaquinone methyltransferase/2-methoxy-6-polyprenyl-1,4-benzoquinol methylase
MTEQQSVNFGFRKVDASSKAGLVGEVFSSVADSYDIMNDLMSLTLHRRWKKEFVGQLRPQSGEKILDLASGTGDIAKLIIEKAPGCKVITSDINYEMLKNGRDRFINENVGLGSAAPIIADAEKLPFQSKSFDAVTIAFGIRNVTNIENALSEAYRVLKTGGRFYCLEFSKVQGANLAKIYDFYSFKVIPRIGKLVAKNEDAYQYLVESIRNFPDQALFKRMIESSGFGAVNYTNLNAGVVAIHKGWKI